MSVLVPALHPRTHLTVLAPAYFPNLGYVKYLVKSAEKNGLDVQFYGLEKKYVDWFQVQLLDLKDELEKVKTSHVLYTDARDVVVCANENEILSRYMQLGAPPLLFSRVDDDLCAGGWMGETEAAYHALNRVLMRGVDPNPQIRWRDAARDGLVDVGMDTDSEIFFTVEENWELIHKPCFFHFAGGYSDPETGKEHLMLPLMEHLGYV